MDRVNRTRVAGILLLVLAAVAVLLSRAATTRLAGQPVAVAIEPPPAVGDCVQGLKPGAGPTSAGNSQFVLIPYADFGPCGGSVQGEVISVQATAALDDQVSLAAYNDLTQGCAQGVQEFLGADHLTTSTGSARFIGWEPAVRYSSQIIGPDPTQRAAGRRWSACVIGSAVEATYRGELHGVLRVGQIPNGFGYCLNSVVVADWTPCGTAHFAQVLGWGAPTDRMDGAVGTDNECATVAARMMRAADPSKGGQLVVGPIGSTAPGAVLACGVHRADGRALTGSVLGIANGTLPTTG